MRIARKLVSIAAATALVAGAGMAMAAPAQAATKKGDTVIQLTPAVVGASLAAGLGVYALSPASSALGGGNSLSITLPAKQKSLEGAPITHKGGIVFANGAKGKILTCKNPTIVTDANPIVITCTIGGAGAPLDGTAPAVLKLDSVKSKTKKGTTTITANVMLNDALPVDQVLNSVLQTTVFSSGMSLGTAKVTLK